jgi:hypothetical protein
MLLQYAPISLRSVPSLPSEAGEERCRDARDYIEEDYPNSCVPSLFVAETVDFATTLGALCHKRKSRDAMALVLEDDIVPSEEWLKKTMSFVRHRAPKNWGIVSLYVPNLPGISEHSKKIDSSIDGYPYDLRCCTQATLFRCSPAIDELAHQMVRFAHRGPKDHLLRRFVSELSIDSYVHVPHLFQHAGPVSSLGVRATHSSELFDDGHKALKRTAFFLHLSGEKTLDPLAACAVRSVADLNPQWRIAVLSNSLDRERFHHGRARLEGIMPKRLIRASPLESWFAEVWRKLTLGALESLLPYALLYSNGGAVIGLHTVTSEPLPKTARVYCTDGGSTSSPSVLLFERQDPALRGALEAVARRGQRAALSGSEISSTVAQVLHRSASTSARENGLCVLQRQMATDLLGMQDEGVMSQATIRDVETRGGAYVWGRGSKDPHQCSFPSNNTAR